MVAKRRFSREFKERAVRRMKDGNVAALARELRVRRKLLYEWRDSLEGRNVSKERPGGAAVATENPTADWKRMAEQLALENRFLANALQRIKEQRPNSAGASGKVSGKPSKPSASSKAD
jgi:transposase-like protein